MTPQNVPLLHEQLGAILLGTIFSFVGLVALSVAAIRRRREFLVLVWFGCFIGMYGMRLLAQTAVALFIALPASWPDLVDVFVTYMLVVPYLLFWVELTLGRLRRFLWWLSAIALVIGIVGLGYFATTGSRAVLLLNDILAILVLIAVGVIVAIPKLSGRFMVVQSRMLSVCLSAIAIAALYYTSSSFLHFQPSRSTEPAAFALWVFAMGYVAGERVFANERRLLAIESELETARQIQFSILPESVPAIAGLRLAVAYQPMSKVAGDFYQFIPVDEHRVGVLVADVTGHGVPAALISSMIKIAMQSVVRFAHDPGEVLRSLNRILSPELRGQLISAAYLWTDTESGCASYSAAGHPPLLYWKSAEGELERIESNGLLFGVTPDSDYPVRILPLRSGDRLLIHTDGLAEAENLAGESFGERQMEKVVREQRSLSASDLLQRLLFELQIWHLPNTPQQDDITLIVMDVL
jgi:sigma-B regulation protein RsbU (phosphoserine phosphatase)